MGDNEWDEGQVVLINYLQDADTETMTCPTIPKENQKPISGGGENIPPEEEKLEEDEAIGIDEIMETQTNEPLLNTKK